MLLEWDHYFQRSASRIGLCIGLKIIIFQANEIVGFACWSESVFLIILSELTLNVYSN